MGYPLVGRLAEERLCEEPNEGWSGGEQGYLWSSGAESGGSREAQVETIHRLMRLADTRRRGSSPPQHQPSHPTHHHLTLHTPSFYLLLHTTHITTPALSPTTPPFFLVLHTAFKTTPTSHTIICLVL
ncbi:hypothetical protein Pcinc_025936 [Petrolisthes cinctipes]|uniref:Uncharacterized protein n=1 Tax=Petrolisthes cinctipes TaxID=88211 RepID=A0AAE1F896_PETCI|nr:hypothetical protein Pcinc_025936 [Petrolisthes cinctipes]